MAPISVVICCGNVADTLEAACRSVKDWADELVIVDSGSTDATGRIAQAWADRYLVEPWRGYTEQKKYGASLARNDWVLVLDGDEEVTPGLAAEFQSLTTEELAQYDVLLVRRQTYALGQPARAWWPDWQSRLIHKTRCVWADAVIHDDRLPSHPSRVRRLRGHLEHKRHSAAGFKDYFHGRAEDGRMELIARDMHARGRRCRWVDLAFRPPLAFLKAYVGKLGFLDGTFGLMIAQRAAISVHLKYATLWAIQNNLYDDQRGAVIAAGSGSKAIITAPRVCEKPSDLK